MKILDTILSAVLSLLMLLIVLDVTWQILTRFFTETPSSWTEEIARFLLIWIGLLGAAWAYRQQAHLGLNYLVQKFEAPVQKKLAVLTLCLSLVFLIAVMVVGGGYLVALSFELKQVSASTGIPIGFIYSVIPLSGFIMTLYAVDDLRQLMQKRGEV